MPETNFSELERAYRETVIGEKSPHAAMCSGAVLNAQLKTNEYDPKAMYLVTKSGIVQLSEDTTEWP